MFFWRRNTSILIKCVFEPCAVKIARTVLKGGKLERAYLSKSQGFATLKKLGIKPDACPVLEDTEERFSAFL